jgi:hypothetical protein
MVGVDYTLRIEEDQGQAFLPKANEPLP